MDGARRIGWTPGSVGLVTMWPCGHCWVFRFMMTPSAMRELVAGNRRMPCLLCRAARRPHGPPVWTRLN